MKDKRAIQMFKRKLVKYKGERVLVMLEK